MGLLWLLPLVAIAVALYLGSSTPSNKEEYSDADTYTRSYTEVKAETSAEADTIAPAVITPFDPNEADYRTLIEAGVPRKVAVSIIKWREGGKVYRIKEDLALCYNMSDSLYFILEPYIVIGDEYRIKAREYDNTSHINQTTKEHTWAEPCIFSLDTVGTSFLRNIGFTLRQAELVIRYRDLIGGYRSFEEFEECYAVDSAMAQLLLPYIIFPERDSITITPRMEFPIEINGADSATLCQVSGIGAKSAQEIVRYRELLGGYHNVEQIRELNIITTENFSRILPQISCDSSKIKKISINFAGQNELMVHPYLSNRMLRRIIKHRELKGGWSTIDEMIEDDIFSDDEAMKIAPYLDFGTNPK